MTWLLDTVPMPRWWILMVGALSVAFIMRLAYDLAIKLSNRG